MPLASASIPGIRIPACACATLVHKAGLENGIMCFDAVKLFLVEDGMPQGLKIPSICRSVLTSDLGPSICKATLLHTQPPA